jgi:long-subunit fatty acid transport protein
MKQYILTISLITSIASFAQVPDDALKLSWHTGNGTARNIAIGGVMGSLGGDITSANINPAGLGLYKTKEFVLSPGTFNFNNKLNYRGTDTSSTKGGFSYGPIGFVFGKPSRYKESNWTSSAISISVNQMASYNNRVQYSGFNNFSSFSEQYLEELVRDRADTNAALRNYIFGSSLAFRSYLIDTIRGANGSFAGYQSLVPITSGVNQNYDATTIGGYHEIALGMAGNIQDRLYIGGSVIIPVVSYRRDFVFKEADATNNPNNQFANFTYSEQFQSNGVGIGAKLGVIYKPQDSWRLGFAFHTPQVITFTDKIRSSLITNTESYAGTIKVTSDELNSGNAGERKYNVTTPYRAIGSVSYVFKEVKDVRQQKGFISADVEFVNYKGARFRVQNAEDDNRTSYLDKVNDGVKSYFKGNFNFKVGGELKFNVFAVRLGTAYFGSPYTDAQIDASRVLATGGIGYRNKGMFIDLGYAHTFVKDVNFAYRLNDVANTYATQTGSTSNIVLTLGFKW